MIVILVMWTTQHLSLRELETIRTLKRHMSSTPVEFFCTSQDCVCDLNSNIVCVYDVIRAFLRQSDKPHRSLTTVTRSQSTTGQTSPESYELNAQLDEMTSNFASIQGDSEMCSIGSSLLLPVQ